MHCLSEALARLEFLLDTLIDDHVRIHCHTERKDETGDTREGEDGAERCEGSEEEHHVGEEGCVSCKACSLIEEDHVQEDEHECDEEGDETAPDGLGTEGRSDDLLLDDGRRGGKLTGLEDVGKVGSLIHGEVAADLGVASGDGAVHHGI